MPDETTDLAADDTDPAVDDAPAPEEAAPGIAFGSDEEYGPDEELGPDEGYAPPRDLSRQVALVATALSVVAGVLCVVAPFRAVYVLRNGGISASFDGWGRYTLASGSQHGPRYGVALTLAALILIIAAASRLRDLRPVHLDPLEPDIADGPDADPEPSPDDRLAAGLGIAGSALLLGVLGSVALNIESTVSNADAIAATPGGSATSVDVGAMLWFMLGAWVVSVAAVYLPWFEARRRA